MPADPWADLLEGSERLAAALETVAPPEYQPETPFERLRRFHGEMMNREKPRPTLTLIEGGRDDG